VRPGPPAFVEKKTMSVENLWCSWALSVSWRPFGQRAGRPDPAQMLERTPCAGRHSGYHALTRDDLSTVGNNSPESRKLRRWALISSTKNVHPFWMTFYIPAGTVPRAYGTRFLTTGVRRRRATCASPLSRRHANCPLNAFVAPYGQTSDSENYRSQA